MWRNLLVGGALVVPFTVALAQSTLEVRRSYTGRGEGEIALRTIVLDRDAVVVAADVDVGAPGCGGSLGQHRSDERQCARTEARQGGR